jgi:hypothetical protein
MSPISIWFVALAILQDAPPPPVIHSVCDLSQRFSFYMDGRFHAQYLKEVGRDARNWGSLELLDLANVNLLVLTGGDPRLPYADAALDHVENFVRGGGTVLMMADGGEPSPPGEAFVERFHASLMRDPADARAFRPHVDREQRIELDFRGGSLLGLGGGWEILAEDQGGRGLCGRLRLDRGWLVFGSRGLFGQAPDASDPLNAEWVTALLLDCTRAKPIDPKLPHRSTWAEMTKEIGPLTLEFHAGTARFADRIAEEYLTIRPHLVALTGVEPSPGMITRLLILPTGGGGFSSGERIAIGAWWGDYPAQRYPMVELIGHEAGHSWVLPHAEPLWNEPIATWLGIRVGMRLGMPAAEMALASQIAAARALDPAWDAIDPLAPGAPRDLVWGKSFHVFEELERLHGPGAMAKYFTAKRRLLASARAAYTMDDCVAVWSVAVGTDLFPWFRSLAFDVDPARSDLAPR